MFGKKRQAARIDSLIGQNSVVQGDILFAGGLHVDGTVKGNIVATSEYSQLTVSEYGAIEGEVRVPNVALNGQVVGDVYANEKIELASEARVSGTVYYSLIEMAIGAEVNGKLVHRAGDESSDQLIELKEEKLIEVD